MLLDMMSVRVRVVRYPASKESGESSETYIANAKPRTLRIYTFSPQKNMEGRFTYEMRGCETLYF